MASSPWEKQIRQTRDDLANLADAKAKHEEVFRSLTVDRQALEARISTTHILEHEALQSGLLLDLIDINATT
jgi:hypothetical protein